MISIIHYSSFNDDYEKPSIDQKKKLKEKVKKKSAEKKGKLKKMPYF